MKKGKFITFEGPEGSGKSTQIKRLQAYLEKQGFSVLLIREPGSTKISEAIRHVILSKDHDEMVQETELLLYLAARAQLIQEKILPALQSGKIVICDRYEDSTLAYQGFGRGISLKDIVKVSELFVRGNLKPDLTLLLDLPPQAGFQRVKGRRDRMEAQSLAFHDKVRKGFLALAHKEPKRFAVLDARQSKSEIEDQIRGKVKNVLR